MGHSCHPELVKLANLGKDGHSRTKLLRTVPIASTMPQPCSIRVPCMPTKGMQVAPKFLGTRIHLPNEIFECIYRYYPKAFQHLCGEGLDSFWNNVLPTDLRVLCNQALFEREGWQKRLIPFVLHGDGVQFTMKNHSLLCVSMCGMLSKGWSMGGAWLLACFPQKCRTYSSVHGEGNDTWEIIWKCIVQSWKAMSEGFHP